MAYLFIARGLEQHAPEPEETEQLQVRKLPLTHVYQMLDDGLITDSMTVAAILKVKSIL